MKNIIIGLSGSQCDFDSTEFIKEYVNNHYTDSIEKIGGVPIILPLTDNRDIVEKYTGLIDALILTGGDDINPQLFHEESLPEVQVPHLKRDTFDMLLIESALKKNIPILGVCRGMQILNVYFGGSLYQDLRYHKDAALKHLQGMNNPDIPVHKVKTLKGSFLGKLFPEDLWVNSFHHQCIKDLGENFVVTARSTDNIIEAVEYIDEDHFILGVQWHPEMMYSYGSEDMKKLFQDFYEQVKIKKLIKERYKISQR